MKGRPIDELVHECMFPPSKAKATDPQNFRALLQRSLVPEVRAETTSFYGDLETKEAQYPGLDYSHLPHRQRLSRFTWHRRLFRAFDTLGLTKSEIACLTKWEVGHSLNLHACQGCTRLIIFFFFAEIGDHLGKGAIRSRAGDYDQGYNRRLYRGLG
jgi:hypothetical protein